MSEAFRNRSESVRGRAGPAASPWTPGRGCAGARRTPRHPGGPASRPRRGGERGRETQRLAAPDLTGKPRSNPAPRGGRGFLPSPTSIKPWASGSAFPTLPYFFTAPCFLTMRLHWRMPAPRPASTFAILHCPPGVLSVGSCRPSTHLCPVSTGLGSCCSLLPPTCPVRLHRPLP